MIKSIAIALCVLLLGIIPSAVSAHPSSAPAPTVTGVSPNQGYNYQPTTITISGGDFVATPTARLNNIPLTNVTFVDSATLTAIVPADLPGGAYTLTVTNPDTQSATLSNAFTVLHRGNGILGSWQTTSAMTTPRHSLGAVAANGYLYALGGTPDWSNTALSSVERAVINTDGSLGSWQIISSMTTARSRLATVSVGGYLYALGGDDISGNTLSSVERAVVNADGSLGPWQVTSSMTTPRGALAAVATSGYVYALGGSDLSSVEYAAINPDGSLGAWQVTSSMTTTRYYLAAVVAGGYLYALDGMDGGTSVERAAINSDGSIGPWQAVTPLPEVRWAFAAVAVDGYLYALGGNLGQNWVDRTAINPDGSLSAWQRMASMTVWRAYHTAAASGGYLYALGGYNNLTQLT